MSVHDPNVSLSSAHLNPDAPEPQNEQLPVKRLTLVAVVSLAAFALGVVWAAQIIVAQRGVVENVAQKAPFIGRPEIGMVDQTLFTLEKRAAQMAQDKADRLNNFGWVSRRDQLIHIPVQDAMKQVAAGKRPQGAGQQPGLQPGTQPAPGPGPSNEPTPTQP